MSLLYKINKADTLLPEKFCLTCSALRRKIIKAHFACAFLMYKFRSGAIIPYKVSFTRSAESQAIE